MNKKIIIYAVALGLLAIGLKALEYHFIVYDHSVELYGGIIALLFILVGIYAGRKSAGKKEVVVERLVPVQNFELNEQQLDKLGLSKREFEILVLMAEGLSNQEIATKAFVSVHTVKTHVPNILLKLDAKRRTQAIMKAKEMSIIP